MGAWHLYAIFGLFLLYCAWDWLYLNYMVAVIVQRGILGPDCVWWGISDWTMGDPNGVQLYRRLRAHERPVPIRIGTTRLHLVTDTSAVSEIMQASPDLFGVGKLKYDMFKTFMPKNVGVSEGCPWRVRRLINENVLFTDRAHPMERRWLGIIARHLTHIPADFKELMRMGRAITSEIVFGRAAPDAVYEIFGQANNLWTVWSGGSRVDPDTQHTYTLFLRQCLVDPVPESLVHLAVQHLRQINTNKVITDRVCKNAYQRLDQSEELLNQIPHWVFPIFGNIHTNAPRLLAMLCNYREHVRYIESDQYLRWCALETLRLNNPVVTTFRTLLTDTTLQDIPYKRGDQFMILNNGILRNSAFGNPDMFEPERWSELSEEDPAVVMFNQGPQRCPGKEIALFVMAAVARRFFALSPNLQCSARFDDKPPAMINPCALKFH